MDTKRMIIVFDGKSIRRIWHNNEWWFSVVDIVGALTVSGRARKYWSDLKNQLQQEGFQLSENIGQLKLTSRDGKSYATDCVNTKNAFRLIQSIPSRKAEPFKQWLAQVGYDRVQEIQDPELAQARMKELYRAKGYPEGWIEKRVRGIAIRQELTDEWKRRGVEEEREYAILTNEISKATFGKTVEEYKKHKGLERENLRDHMHDLELIFTMLGEASTTRIARSKDSQGLDENKDAAARGGTIAGEARRRLEEESGQAVISQDNYLSTTGGSKKKLGKRTP